MTGFMTGRWESGCRAEVAKRRPARAADVLLPVPAHRERQRGYHQARLISKLVCLVTQCC